MLSNHRQLLPVREAAFRGTTSPACTQPCCASCPSPLHLCRRYGACMLLRSNELAGGAAPAYTDFSAVTVPLTSGWLVPGAAQPAAEPAVLAQGAGRRLFQL